MKLSALLFSILFTNMAFADGFHSVPPSILFDYAYGQHTHDFEVALGLAKQQPKNSFGGLYYGQEQLKNGGHVESIGVIALTLSPNKATNSYGAKIKLGMSRTSINSYQRKGLEAGGYAYDFVTERLSLFGGAIIRPTILSNQYKSNSKIEFVSKIGANYHVSKGIEIYGQYRYSGVLNRKFSSTNLKSGFQLGISLLF